MSDVKSSVSSKERSKRPWLYAYLLVLLMVAYVGMALILPLPTVMSNKRFIASPAAKTVNIIWPSYGQTAVGAPGYGVLASHGDSKPIPTASIAKVLTALAVLKQHPLLKGQAGPVLTITADDVANYQKYSQAAGSVVPVQVGEQLTEYQALQALLLPSANNIADLLASWAFGSTSQYVSFANLFAKSLGLDQTTVADASGFSSKTTSTAHDLVLLGENVVDNPVLAEIVGQPQATIPVAGVITNVNLLLGHQEIVGIKTGNTNEAGGCFMVAAKHVIDSTHQIIVIAVTLGAPDLATAINNTLPLLQSVYPNFQLTTLVPIGTVVGSYQADWGAQAQVATTTDVQGIIWKAAPPTVIVDLPSLSRAGNATTTVGTVSATFGRQKVSSPVSPIRLPAASLRWRLSHPLSRL